MFKVSGFSIGGRLLRPIFRYVFGLLAKEVSSYLPSSKKQISKNLICKLVKNMAELSDQKIRNYLK